MTNQQPTTDAPLFAEFLDDFFAECDEHLTSIRQAILAIEPLLPQGRLDQALLDDLFRGFHSLKGLSAMVGLAEAERLAHQLESFLRLAREGAAPLTTGSLNLLIEGSRVIEQVIAARRTSAPPPPIEPTLERLAGLLEPPPLSSPRSPEETAITTAPPGDTPRWIITFAPTAELAARGVNVNLVRARLQQEAQLISAAPRVGPEGGIAFEFLVAHPNPDALRTGLEDALSIAPYTPSAPVQAIVQSPQPALRPDPVEIMPAETLDAPVAPSQVVRVNLNRLDDLLQLTGELVIARARLANQLAAVEPLLPTADWRALQETGRLLERQLRSLRAAVVRVRLAPVGELFARMQFVVRDLARSLGKEVQLEVYGPETELDKFVVERLFDPLLHLVRNAVGHGLEHAEERVAVGKPAAGVVVLGAEAAGDTVLITVVDDGRGVDLARVAERARRLGLLHENEILDQGRLLDLLCAPGFSTRDEADRVSGRGVGMDVVRKTVGALGGAISLRSAPGQGTRFSLKLPLTLAIADALIVEVSGQLFAVPIPLVREVLRVTPDAITGLGRSEIMLHRGEPLPLLRLARRFGLAETPRPAWHAFIAGDGGRSVGFLVDRLLGKREIVVRPISDPLAQTPGIAGATELGDGRPILILDLAGLMGE